MFGALRFNSVTKDVEHVELERADGFEARGYSRTACNECRTRKLKCSGDKDGCQRCRAVSITCIYQPNTDKSLDKFHRQFAQSSTNLTSSSPEKRVEREQDTRPASRQKPRDHTQSSKIPNTGSEGNAPQIQGPSAAPITPVEVSWTLSSLPDASDIDWAFPSGDAQHMMDVDENSSFADNIPRTPTLSSCTSPTYENLPHEVPNIQMNLKEGSQKVSESWDPIISSASVTDSPGKDPWFVPGLSYLDGPQAHGSPADVFAALNMTSRPSTSELPSITKSPNARLSDLPGSYDTGNPCQCVTVMLNILENIGVRGLGGDAQETGARLDDILSSLARGMKVMEQVLVCSRCNACAENGMLLATIAQQLGTTASSVTACLPSEENPCEQHEGTRWRRNRGVSTHGSRSSVSRTVNSNESMVNSSNDGQTSNDSDLLEGAIFFGRYKIHSPDIRLQIMYHALLLHIGQLRDILTRLKDKVVLNSGARKILIHEEIKLGNLWEIFHSKVSY
ncbi:hypothetical protein F5Y11DRAFT_293630 [Daldinia sp. FL1419]|nr:hypothetical protein F5Y11DRAFT_293630 [Daldinia sp. FL1419]